MYYNLFNFPSKNTTKRDIFTSYIPINYFISAFYLLNEKKNTNFAPE